MKHKKKVARLEKRQKWYDSQSQSYKAAHKRPESINRG